MWILAKVVGSSRRLESGVVKIVEDKSVLTDLNGWAALNADLANIFKEMVRGLSAQLIRKSRKVAMSSILSSTGGAQT